MFKLIKKLSILLTICTSVRVVFVLFSLLLVQSCAPQTSSKDAPLYNSKALAEQWRSQYTYPADNDSEYYYPNPNYQRYPQQAYPQKSGGNGRVRYNGQPSTMPPPSYKYPYPYPQDNDEAYYPYHYRGSRPQGGYDYYNNFPQDNDNDYNYPLYFDE